MVGSEEEYRTAEKKLTALNKQISAYNSSLARLLKSITAYKEGLENESIAPLQKEIQKLAALERLDTPDVSDALTAYNAAALEKSRLEDGKLKARGKIDAQMEAILSKYQMAINDLLKSYGAQFSIEQLNPNPPKV